MISKLIPATINHLLANEAWARARVANHAGKVARINLGVTVFNLRAEPDGLVQSAADDDVPTVTIHVKPADLPLILRDRERAVSYVRIEGDADFANMISQLSQSLKWEAEEDLSGFIGDIAAMRVTAGAKSAVQLAQATHRKITENAAEYFIEENPMLIRQRAAADFADEVTRLRDDVERLSKRVDKLKGSSQA